MMKIIGSKDKIAIEFDVVKSQTPKRNYGNILLFLDEKPLGYYKELINLDAFKYQLQRLIDNKNVFF